jgi:hypothetical protein
LAPAQEGISFLIAQEFQFGIELKGLRRAEFVDLHRVIDDQLSRLKGIDQSWIAGKALHGVTHGSEINHRRHSGKILQQHAAGRESDFLGRLRLVVP